MLHLKLSGYACVLISQSLLNRFHYASSYNSIQAAKSITPEHHLHSRVKHCIVGNFKAPIFKDVKVFDFILEIFIKSQCSVSDM